MSEKLQRSLAPHAFSQRSWITTKRSTPKSKLTRLLLWYRIALIAGKTFAVKMRLKVNLLNSLMIGYLATTFVSAARGDSELVIAIRYLQAAGVSHAHLYLYREDGKLLRQLTNDNSGQDVDPIFAPNGEMIVWTREKPNDVREFWSIEPRGAGLKRLDNAPDWYTTTRSSPYFTNR